MAQAHVGQVLHASPRLKILLCLCELQQSGSPATYRAVGDRLNMSNGSLSHHIGVLENERTITRSRLHATLELTPAGLAELIADGWLTPVPHVVAYELSTRAIEALEVEEDDS